jgi:hypothetical protein
MAEQATKALKSSAKITPSGDPAGEQNCPTSQ